MQHDNDKPLMPAPPLPREGRRGRPANNIIFPDAATLWRKFTEYREWCAEPINMIDVNGKGRRVVRPLTNQGFAAFVQCSASTIVRATSRDDLKDTWGAIQSEIDDGLVSNGLLRVYEAGIVNRVARLVDHQSVETTPTEPVQVYDWSKLTDDELATVTKLLEKAEIND